MTVLSEAVVEIETCDEARTQASSVAKGSRARTGACDERIYAGGSVP